MPNQRGGPCELAAPVQRIMVAPRLLPLAVSGEGTVVELAGKQMVEIGQRASTSTEACEGSIHSAP